MNERKKLRIIRDYVKSENVSIIIYPYTTLITNLQFFLNNACPYKYELEVKKVNNRIEKAKNISDKLYMKYKSTKNSDRSYILPDYKFTEKNKNNLRQEDKLKWVGGKFTSMVPENRNYYKL